MFTRLSPTFPTCLAQYIISSPPSLPRESYRRCPGLLSSPMSPSIGTCQVYKAGVPSGTTVRRNGSGMIARIRPNAQVKLMPPCSKLCLLLPQPFRGRKTLLRHNYHRHQRRPPHPTLSNPWLQHTPKCHRSIHIDGRSPFPSLHPRLHGFCHHYTRLRVFPKYLHRRRHHHHNHLCSVKSPNHPHYSAWNPVRQV